MAPARMLSGSSESASTRPANCGSPRGGIPPGAAAMWGELLLEGHVDDHLVTLLAGVHDADTRAQARDLGRSPWVSRRPVAVRVTVVERRDRRLRSHDGRGAVAVEGHRVGGLLAERGVERLTAVAEHDAAIEHDR